MAPGLHLNPAPEQTMAKFAYNRLLLGDHRPVYTDR